MLIDAFNFFCEKEIVELRLKYLNEVVDYFVVIEADVTHQGKKKDWNFPNLLNNDLKEFAHKIQYHQVKIDLVEAHRGQGDINEHFKGGYSFKIDNMQRNYIRKACNKFSPNDIIIFSDLDEIPSKQILTFIKSCEFETIAPVALEQDFFHLNCNYLKNESWKGSIIVTKKIIDRFLPQELRNWRNRVSCFAKSGWHFSSFGGADRVIKKMESYAHLEYNNEAYKNIEHIKNCQKTGADLFKRTTEIAQSRKVTRDFFPKDLLILMEKNNDFYFGSNN